MPFPACEAIAQWQMPGVGGHDGAGRRRDGEGEGGVPADVAQDAVTHIDARSCARDVLDHAG
jgi:hypothetical protein